MDTDLEKLLAYCRRPAVDTLIRAETEGGRVFTLSSKDLARLFYVDIDFSQRAQDHTAPVVLERRKISCILPDNLFEKMKLDPSLEFVCDFHSDAYSKCGNAATKRNVKSGRLFCDAHTAPFGVDKPLYMVPKCDYTKSHDNGLTYATCGKPATKRQRVSYRHFCDDHNVPNCDRLASAPPEVVCDRGEKPHAQVESCLNPRQVGKHAQMMKEFVESVGQALETSNKLKRSRCQLGRVRVQMNTSEQVLTLRSFFTAEAWYRVDIDIKPIPEPWTISIVE